MHGQQRSRCTIETTHWRDFVFGNTDIMECTINWVPASGMAFTAETGSGHLLTMDGAPDGGGRNLAPRPM